jgi:glycosyltransferase involved in cell wall biosynthesis
LKILFICDEYPPGPHGGVGTYTRILARELVRQGHQVYVVGLYTYTYGQNDSDDDQGVKVWRLRYGPRLPAYPLNILNRVYRFIPAFIQQHVNGRKAFNVFLDFIYALIEKEKIDVIEIPDWNSFSVHIGFDISWPPFPAPLVVKSHGSYTKIMHDLGKKENARMRRIDQALFSRADALASVSRDTAEIDRRLFGIEAPVEILYNGIEVPVMDKQESADGKNVVYSGSLTRPKGVFQLMRAWNNIHKKVPGAQLHIFGKGKITPLLKLLDADVRSSVFFHGHVSREQLFKELSGAGVAVYPSYTESFSLAPMEAMAVGCPVIYTKRSSGRELIDDRKDGLLVEPDHAEEIADRIVEVLTDSELRKRLSIQGRKKIKEQFNISVVAQKHVDFFRKVVGEFQGHAKNRDS